MDNAPAAPLNASDAAGQSGRQRKTGKRRPENLE